VGEDRDSGEDPGGDASASPARVLLVEADQRAAVLLGEMLRAIWTGGLVLAHAARIDDATRELIDHGASCVLVDLGMADELQVGPLEQIRTAAPDVPVIALSSRSDEGAGMRAIQAGAQDYLIRSELTPTTLSRSIRYAIERKRSEVDLAHQALHDPLTGLPNRALFLDRLGVALDRSRRTKSSIAIVFLDVDDFKGINDTLGHAAGDTVLIGLAGRLQAMLRPMDTVARLGGDEFTFLFEQLGSEREAVLIAERIGHTTSLPIALDVGEASVTVSIGVALVTDPSVSPDSVMRDADTAMYRAKEQGGGRFELFDESSRRRAVERLGLEDGLRRALELSELRVHYQPRVSLNGQTSLVGFEALVRWEHPERGLIEPSEFIHVAEETGLILPIGEYVLGQALWQVGRWRRHKPGVTISVNLSARQLGDAGLVSRLAGAIQASGADPSVLCLEVTEGAVEQDPELAARILAALKDLGVKLAIDDFGTGYSSLAGLKHLPIDTLKLHESFVGELGRERNQSEIVGAVVELGHALGLGVVAEGVETARQLVQIRHLGFDGAQGYLFSAPVPEDEVQRLLAAT
jgi:diguanylate cyclase (GGDEF)-like protein